MKEFIDRVSSGEKIITYEDGTTETVTIENAEDATVEGTPINRVNLMAAQGFSFCETTPRPDGSIVQDFGNGETLTITVADGIVTEVFSGEKTITKKTQIMPNKTIREWIE